MSERHRNESVLKFLAEEGLDAKGIREEGFDRAGYFKMPFDDETGKYIHPNFGKPLIHVPWDTEEQMLRAMHAHFEDMTFQNNWDLETEND